MILLFKVTTNRGVTHVLILAMNRQDKAMTLHPANIGQKAIELQNKRVAQRNFT